MNKLVLIFYPSTQQPNENGKYLLCWVGCQYDLAYWYNDIKEFCRVDGKAVGLNNPFVWAALPENLDVKLTK